jgi:methylase of polypeptide subunit release factors
MVPSPYSLLLAESLEYRPDCSLAVDVGCGGGILSIRMAQLGFPHVVAIDSNEDAVAATRRNAILNHASSVIDARCGNIFDGLRKVDFIACNPPTYPDLPGIPESCIGGVTGYEFLTDLFVQMKTCLSQEGTLLCVLSTLFDVERIMATSKQCGFTMRSKRSQLSLIPMFAEDYLTAIKSEFIPTVHRGGYEELVIMEASR